MPRNKYTKMHKRTVLKLLKDGVYSVNIDTGQVFNRHGKELKQRKNTHPSNGNAVGHLQVYLYYESECACIYVHQLVWMAATMRVPPKGWEIHHLDEDINNNAFINLICVHPLDHRKFHYTPTDEDDPF